MCPASAEPVTESLLNPGHGDQSAREELIPLIYAALRHIARRCLSQERLDHTLPSGALVPGISPAIAKREWAMTRAHLQRETKRKEAGK